MSLVVSHGRDDTQFCDMNTFHKFQANSNIKKYLETIGRQHYYHLYYFSEWNFEKLDANFALL